MSDGTPRARSEWRFGWPIIVGSAAMAGVGSGLYQNLSSLFLPGVEQVTGASRGEVSAAAGFGLLGALAAPFIGRVADRLGVAPVIAVSAFGICATHLGLSFLSGPMWQFQAAVAALALFAPGFSALIYGRLIARRFDRHRGLAMGLATSGLSLTTLLLAPAIGWAIEHWDWRVGYWAMAALALGIGLPAGLWATRVAGDLHPPGPRQKRDTPPSWGNRVFWRLTMATMLINIGVVGMVTQLALIGQERGLGIGASALLLSAYGLSQIAGRLVMGALIDYFPANRIAAAFGIVSAVGFIALLLVPGQLWLMAVAVFAAGLLNGAEYDLMPFLVSRLFPLSVYGEVFGRITLFSIVSGGIGLAGFGLFHDATGGYAAPLAAGAIAMLFATVLLYGLPPYARQADEKGP